MGFFVSIVGDVDPTDDGDPTAVTADEIGSGVNAALPAADRFFLGLVSSAPLANIFLGYTNITFNGDPSRGTSKLVVSDGGIGTSTSDFWRVKNGLSDNTALQILDNNRIRASSIDGCQIHFPKIVANVGGYATLVAMRFQRDNARERANVIRMSVKSSASHSGDILYTNSPSRELLESNLEDFPDTVQQLGPVELSHTPDTLFVYWPFTSSRIRVHCYGILRAASA